jgi:hypothetical protein
LLKPVLIRIVFGRFFSLIQMMGMPSSSSMSKVDASQMSPRRNP